MAADHGADSATDHGADSATGPKPINAGMCGLRQLISGQLYEWTQTAYICGQLIDVLRRLGSDLVTCAKPTKTAYRM